MRRTVLLAGVCASLAVASAALGFNASEFNYDGHLRGDPAFIGFALKRTDAGRRVVSHFTVSQPPIACRDSDAVRSNDGYRFAERLRVRHGTFGGQGEWLIEGLDPVGSLGGGFVRPGVAKGALKLRGELAGPGTHCHTGLLEWRAAKRPAPPL